MKIRQMVSAGVMVGVLGVAPLALAQSAQEPQLEQRADAARTAREHSTVARDYRERGERFEAAAREHEMAARRYDRASTPLDRKWPGSTMRPATKERQLAMEARRAAQESFALADRHLRSSVEALADASPNATANDRTN